MAKRILVADTPDGDRRLSAILSGHDLAFVRTLGEAQRAHAREQFALVLIGVHFDDSRMFDLLRHLQASDARAGCAVICMRSQQFASNAITIEGLEIATKTLGCNLFLDLTWYADDAAGNAAIRSLLEALGARHVALWSPAHADERLRIADELVAAARGRPLPEAAVSAETVQTAA